MAQAKEFVAELRSSEHGYTKLGAVGYEQPQSLPSDIASANSVHPVIVTALR
jgi:hypothetical protein